TRGRGYAASVRSCSAAEVGRSCGGCACCGGHLRSRPSTRLSCRWWYGHDPVTPRESRTTARCGWASPHVSTPSASAACPTASACTAQARTALTDPEPVGTVFAVGALAVDVGGVDAVHVGVRWSVVQPVQHPLHRF